MPPAHLVTHCANIVACCEELNYGKGFEVCFLSCQQINQEVQIKLETRKIYTEMVNDWSFEAYSP